MYKRCISDETGLEPRKLFNLVQFLMYDKTFKGRVTIEETLQILYVRYGRERLDEEIKAIFGYYFLLFNTVTVRKTRTKTAQRKKSHTVNT